MKRKTVYFVTLLVFAGMITMVSCNKEATTQNTEHNTWSVPTAVTPLDGVALAPTSTTTISWAASGGASDSWDVYFGESESPDLYKTAYTSKSLTVPVQQGHTYYWYVTCEDALGIPTESPVFSFSVKVTLNIDNFVGTYDCDEPGYMHYDVHLTKVNGNTVSNDNFWDSGWTVQYQFDEFGGVTLIPATIKISSTTTYTITGEGAFDPATNGFYVDYVVKKNVYTLKLEGNTVVTTTADENTHTFVKK